MSNAVRDLTQGSVPRRLMGYAVPVVTTSLLQAVYSIVDILVVSKLLGPAGVSGVNNASQCMLVLTQIAIGLANGGNILVGQYFGAGDKEERERTTGTFFTLFLILGAVFSLAAAAAARPFMAFMGAPSLEDAVDYLSVAAWGMLFIYLYNAQSAVLRAVGNSRAPLYCILTSTVLNVVLDLLCVGPAGMGTAGAALATVISQGVACAMAMVYLLRHRDVFSWSASRLRLSRRKAADILRIGIPCAVQMTVAGISWLVVTYLINDYGVTWSAGNGFAVKIKDFSMMFITSLSTAASSMIAQNLGARSYDRARSTLSCAMRMAVCMAVFLTVALEFTAVPLLSLFSDDAQVVAAGALNLRIEILGQVFYAVFLTYHGLMMGAGDTWWVFFSSFVNCIAARVILATAFEALWGIRGVFIACAIAPASSVPIGILYARSGRWRKSLTDTR